MKQITLIVMSLFYVIAGVAHFARPGMYMKIMPPYLPAPLALVYLSGVAEIVVGAMLLVPGLRSWGAWGVIALLIAVFPANVYMLQRGGKSFGIPEWTLWARLPLQGVLIAWAYWYT
jgi:uncharacterized membrane protein